MIIATFLSSLWLAVNASYQFEHTLPICCGPNEKYVTSRSSDGRPFGSCGINGQEFVVLPRQLFPFISTDLDDVKVKVEKLVKGLQCDDEGPNDSGILVDLTSLESSDSVAFLAHKLVVTKRWRHMQFSHGHYCISSGMTNKTHLAIETCKKSCSSRHLSFTPNIPRCCGGHQSVVTSLPASHDESFFESCSIPPAHGNNSWDPWTSQILTVDDTFCSEMRSIPRIQPWQHSDPDPQGYCKILRVKMNDGISLSLLHNGNLQMKEGWNEEQLKNFCIDGTTGGKEGNDQGTPEKEEVVIYACNTSIHRNYHVSVAACNDYDSHLGTWKYKARGGVHLSLTVTPWNGAILDCYLGYGYEYLTMGFKDSSEQQYFDESALIRGGTRYALDHQLCIRTIDKSFTFRLCVQEDELESVLTRWWFPFPFYFSLGFYVTIAVVYILRNDKELIFRCSIVTYLISTTFFHILLLCTLLHLQFERQLRFPIFIIVLVMFFFYLNASSWMCVLCFDVWLTITFLRPGNTSTKRLWVYIAFTFALPSVLIGIIFLLSTSKPHPSSRQQHAKYVDVLNYLWNIPIWVNICVNLFLFLATAAKLWIPRHSNSDFQNNRNTFLLYFKLFLLMGLRWTIDLLYFPRTLQIFTGQQVLKPPPTNLLNVYVATFLLFLHPILLFFFLLWNSDTNIFLENNYPRFKRVVDFIGVIGYPVRKFWTFFRHYTRSQETIIELN